MTILLDTHIWLWWYTNNPLLSQATRNLLANPNNTILVSTISVWEVTIKRQIGKLTIEGDIVVESEAEGIEFLSFDLAHAQSVAKLPTHHRDPFDRALLAQAASSRLNLLTSDRFLKAYDREVNLIFA